MRSLDKGLNKQFHPFRVGYANRPKRPEMGGYVAFSPTYGPVWL